MKWPIVNRKTLLFRMFASFLSIILMFSVFNVLSIFLFNRGVQHEVIQYNRLMLNNTAELYRAHFERIRTMLFETYRNGHVVGFYRQLARTGGIFEPGKASEVLKVVRAEAFNPMYYLNNLLIYYGPGSLIVDKEGTVDAEMMFSRFYTSRRYPFSYWKGQSDRSDNYVLHPNETFKINDLSVSYSAQLIPFSFRMPSSDYMVIALLDARMLHQTFFGEDDDRLFMIVREDGTPVYRSSGALSLSDIPAFEGGKEYALAGDRYYFAEKDPAAGLTYITAVPSADIASRVRNASLTLLVVFVVSVVICVLASLYFSRKINRPVKQMIASLLRRDPVKVPSPIQEFDLIQRNIGELMKEQEAIRKELLGKRTLLTSFGYINKLKAITSDINEWKDIAGIDEPFVLVLYQLHFKSQSVSASQLKTDRMAYYIREYIHVVISERMPSSHTFQIENNQILSLIRSEEAGGALEEALESLKTILDRDKAYLLVTIAVSSVYDGSAQFNSAYREVLHMAQQARPLDESQLLRAHRAVPDLLLLTVPEEQELYANLQAGNRSYCISFMERALDRMDKKGASIQQLREFAGGVIAKAAKILEPFGTGADASMRLRYVEHMGECFTLDQFKQLFERLFSDAATIIQANKEKRDSTISLVMEMIENRYADDLSLDLLADKLNLSAAYLSVYIKEKTGANFSDHLNAVRVRKAKELLSGTDLSVQEISVRIGYRNVTSFNRMFKKITGIPPGEYRKKEWLKAE
ncbi:hypothetical protein PACILC2_30630 [Paenibacillus cisolokensis]|uniref:HTH araC/xylS-type domain-containing protein n=1 Tax=Paenibacillus cisolokensis TaxID=1658519 RepID=A0ABQ4N8H5_9BACL|nr:helix-turn-helix domain-containing protein [Paenibacillus cisolokensis]GIQ64495.1 hypothetical protein PACILC2_30630 [Paenibacillus cisolokensis]